MGVSTKVEKRRKKRGTGCKFAARLCVNTKKKIVREK
jgi:hypothetical protein